MLAYAICMRKGCIGHLQTIGPEAPAGLPWAPSSIAGWTTNITDIDTPRFLAP